MTSPPITPITRENEWLDYYPAVTQITPNMVRDGCHPRIYLQPNPVQKAIILVQGLTDSPFFMTDIAEFFFQQGYNVYLPLLHMHGLKEPNNMLGVSLERWKAEVDYAVAVASTFSENVSIGGLSTVGALSLYQAVNEKRINGTVYLFSAALDIKGVIGEFKERILRHFAHFLPKEEYDLIGENPFRYSRMDNDGAVQLAKLIAESDEIVKHPENFPTRLKIFAAHSESDNAADIKAIERLENIVSPDRFHFFRINRIYGIPHASVVLKNPLVVPEKHSSYPKILEVENSRFLQMIAAINTPC